MLTKHKLTYEVNGFVKPGTDVSLTVVFNRNSFVFEIVFKVIGTRWTGVQHRFDAQWFKLGFLGRVKSGPEVEMG